FAAGSSSARPLTTRSTSKSRVGPKTGRDMQKMSPPQFIPPSGSITLRFGMMIRLAAVLNTFPAPEATLASRSSSCSGKPINVKKQSLSCHAVILLLLLAACSCGRRQVEGSAMSSFVDEYFDALFEWLPSTATAIGFHQYDSKIEDLS